MEISAALVKSLREKTGAGMMDCKKALSESGGDMEKAIDFLRKKGAATAEKRMDRSANEGIILTSVEDGKGFMIEINCETDFVARSEDFLGFANRALQSLKSGNPANVEALLSQTDGSHTLSEYLSEVVGKIGEKMEIKRFASFSTNGALADYIHPGNKLGVIVEIQPEKKNDEAVTGLAKELAMQIAAMNPVSISRDDVPKEIIEKELEIYRQQAREQGKPENMLDKIAVGKLNKYYQEFTLLEQSYIRDASKTVKEYLDEASKSFEQQLKVARFERYHIGESA